MFPIDLLFEWLYKTESLQALSEAGYFDRYLVAGQYDLSPTRAESPLINEGHEPAQDDFCHDGVASEVSNILIIYVLFHVKVLL